MNNLFKGISDSVSIAEAIWSEAISSPLHFEQSNLRLQQ